MFFVILHPKVPTNSQSFEEGEGQEPIRKVIALKRVKVMTVFRMFEEEKSRKLAILKGRMPKRVKVLSSMIRMQLEEIKGKVRAISPAALQFIGPGDH